MPTNTQQMSAPDLSAIIKGLLESGVEFILVGGLAAVIQGAPVTTMDVDIVHKRSSENISKLFTFLESHEAIYRRLDNKHISPQKEDFTGMGHTLLSTRLGPLDVLAFVEGGKTYEDLLAHTTGINFRGHLVRVLEIETLIELKKVSRDAEDKQRLSILEETLRQLKKESGRE